MPFGRDRPTAMRSNSLRLLFPPMLAAIHLSGPPAIAHSKFETAKELGRSDIESCGDLD